VTTTILGGDGFIGSSLAPLLRDKGDRVTSLRRPAFDLTLPKTFGLMPAHTQVLVHAAGHVGGAPEDEVLWQTNVKSTYYLARYLNQVVRPRLVVYLSSGAVYGTHAEPITASSMLRPLDLYGLSKLLSEATLQATLRARLVVLRLFFPFGPGQRPPRLIPSLVQKVARGEPVDVYGAAGGLVINPIFINELTMQIAHIIREPKQTCYNLGGANTISIKEIVEAIGRCLGREPRLNFKEGNPERMVCVPDVRESPRMTFEEQLAEVVRKADYL